MADLDALADQVADADAVLLDWDGCLARGGRLLPGARALLLALGSRAWILSNNSTDVPQGLQRLLEGEQVRLPAERILLAGHHTLCRQAVQCHGRPVHLVANPRMREFAANLGLLHAEADVEAVVLLRDTTFTFAKLAAASTAARACGRIVLANPDLTHPGPDGTLAPETGALHAAIRACLGGSPVEVEIIGKPSPAMFDAVLAQAGVEPAYAVMIGDNPTTDGAGATAAGLGFVQVDPDGVVSMAALAPRITTRLASSSRRSARA